MKVIKFTTGQEAVTRVDTKDFAQTYMDRVGKNEAYRILDGGDIKHLAVCPKCNNPVVILGVFRHIDQKAHARHCRKGAPGLAEYNEYKYINCPFHRRHANYIGEYVPEFEKEDRKKIYELARDHFDKAVYLIERTVGIRINISMAEEMAGYYAAARAYEYKYATTDNIPWFLLYGFPGFNLYHKVIKKDSALYRHLKKAGGVKLIASNKEGYVYVEEDGITPFDRHLICDEYGYDVDKDDEIHEHLAFAILETMDDGTTRAINRFRLNVDPFYFGNLVGYADWKRNNILCEAVRKYFVT